MTTISALLRDVRRRAGSTVRARFGRAQFATPPATPLERRRDYERDGFVAGGPLLDRRELAALRSDFDRIFASHADPSTGVRGERMDDGAGGEYFRLYDFYKVSDAFLHVVTHPRLATLLAELTGVRRFRVLLDQIQYKPPKTGGWNGWHRDMPSFPLVAPYTALTAWVALDDAVEENGCMQMVPGSHGWGDAADLCGDDWGLPALPETYRGHAVRRVLRPVRAGHVHFHHERTWHCSSPNRTNGPRRALAVLYIGAEDRYREGGKIVFPELKQGDAMDAVAPLIVTAPSP